MELEPVALEVVRVCKWKAKGCGVCGAAKANAVHKPGAAGGHPFKRRQGCANCGKAKNDPDHIGAPESFNVFASGSWEAYQTAKKRWHRVLAPLLDAKLPRGLARVVVEGECSFGDSRDRDQGNHRVVLEKALGDVLEHGDPENGVAGGWLPDDTWTRYEFGNLTRSEEPGVNRLRLTLFPTLADAVVAAAPPAHAERLAPAGVDPLALFG